MKIRPFIHKDLATIGQIGPADWGDITPYFRFYIENPSCCHPFVAEEAGRVIGSGNYTFVNGTAWLSHIIVVPEFRNKGTGKSITELLVSELHKNGCRSIMLIATPSGEAVYKKLGFHAISKYIFLKDSKKQTPSAEGVRPLLKTDMPKVMMLDKKVSGEDRSHLLRMQTGGWVVDSGSELKGFYLSGVWEGPVIAKEPQSGIALLCMRIKDKEVVILPEQNVAGIDFLKANGFEEYHEPGTRMYLGENISWQSEMIFGRIGGAFG
jgi:GNAT superfamily N-acetyltransferase